VTDTSVRRICGFEPPPFRTLTIETLLDIDKAAGHILDESGYGEIHLTIKHGLEENITYQVSNLLKRQCLS
jgi:hypothetical protein